MVRAERGIKKGVVGPLRSALGLQGICRRGDQARPPKSVHRKRCRARAELLFEHPPSQSHRLSSLVAGNGWSPEHRGERVSHRPMAVFTVQLQAEEPMNILAESGLRTRESGSFGALTLVPSSMASDMGQETLNLLNGGPLGIWDGQGEPSQVQDQPTEPADLDTHWAEPREKGSPVTNSRDRQQWKCDEITAAVLCFQAQDLDRLGTRIKYSEGNLQTWRSGTTSQECSQETVPRTGRTSLRASTKSDPPTELAGCREWVVSRAQRRARVTQTDESADVEIRHDLPSVHRKRCRARAELPCEHPPSQSHRLSSLVAGNGWSPERRGERVSHRPMLININLGTNLLNSAYYIVVNQSESFSGFGSSDNLFIEWSLWTRHSGSNQEAVEWK
ncbi:hypothetical protein MJG53_002323 [Ovis ammon polii x Ovis aries]|uniref:Uncharacterized protein n=1 Tax=Ovis ammon polii x Ovis aries TaxID=2918886 RepID=A0ACB9VDN6_9CETA|nr:hypothetical protein MJG53_002323 [Ovis ammon polii x Ovis aries]